VIARAKWLGVLGAVCVAFVVGRGTQKTVTVEKIREVEKAAQQKVEAAKAEVATAKTAASSDRVQWRTRTIYEPGGTVEVVKEVVREVERKTGETKVEVQTKVVVQERTVFRDRERVTEAPRPGWSMAARAGLGLDGRPRYGGELGRRLFGGLWITAGADVTSRAALVGLRWDF
jgi:hypothetical protein